MTTVAILKEISSDLSTSNKIMPRIETSISGLLSLAKTARFIEPEAMISCKKMQAEIIKAYVAFESCINRAAGKIQHLARHKSVQQQKQTEIETYQAIASSFKSRLTLIDRHLSQHAEENALYDRLDAIKKKVFQISYATPSSKEELRALQAQLTIMKAISSEALTSTSLTPAPELLHSENQSAIEELIGVLHPLILFTERKLEEKAKTLDQIEQEKRLPIELSQSEERVSKLVDEMTALLTRSQALGTEEISYVEKEVKIMAILGRFNKLRQEHAEVVNGLQAFAEIVSKSQREEFRAAWAQPVQDQKRVCMELQEQFSSSLTLIEKFYVTMKTSHLNALESKFWTSVREKRFSEASETYSIMLNLLKALSGKKRSMNEEQAIHFETLLSTSIRQAHAALLGHGIALEQLPEGTFFRNLNVRRFADYLDIHIRLCSEPRLTPLQAMPGATSLLHMLGIAEELPRYVQGLPTEIVELLPKPESISMLEGVVKAGLLAREDVTADFTSRVRDGLVSLKERLFSSLKIFPQHEPLIAV